MTLGLVFREHAKPKRSIRAWRQGIDVGTLPMHTGDLGTPTFRPSLFGGKTADNSDGSEKSNGLGFGRQGEKQAGLKGMRWHHLEFERCDLKLCFAGFTISKPAETVPRYVPRPASLGSSLYSVAEPKPAGSGNTSTSTFRSSPTAI
jgi:hypothetical protein